MAEGDIRRAVQNRCSGLIEHSSRRLLHVARLLILSASVNDGDDSSAGYAKAVLAIREADDLGSRLGRITVPNDRAVILDRRRIVQAGWNAWKRGLRHREEVIRFNTNDP